MDTPLYAYFAEPHLASMVESLGDFFHRFGFKRNVGRVWAALYLAPHALEQEELQQVLGLSAGLVSSALQELEHYTAVRTLSRPGQRRLRYECEARLLPIVSTILAKRELAAVRVLKAAASQARTHVRPVGGTRELHRRMRAIEQCVDLYETLAAVVSRVAALPDGAINKAITGLRAGNAVRQLFKAKPDGSIRRGNR